MPSEGGAPRKLTHLGGMTVTSGWHPDGHILFTSDAESPFAGWRFPYRIAPNRIAPTGGEPEKLPWGPANFVAVNPGGGIVLNRNARDPAYWKRYRGGTAGHFWVDPDGKSGFVRWTEPNGNLVNPMWIGGRIYFLSDHEGVGNLYSALPDGSDLRRHTDHETYYARNAKTDGRRIVYHAGGDIYLYDPETDVTERVAILLPTTATQRARRFVDAAKYLESVDLHPQGHSLLATVRGRLYSFGNWEGPVLEHGESKGTRYRKGSWLPDGKRVVCVVDAGDQEVLEIHDAEGAEPPRRIDSFAFGHVCELTVAPKGKRAAVINHRNQVLVIELETEQVTVVEDNPYGRPQDLAWSPDGTWLAYASHFSRQTIGLKLWRSGEQPVRITDPVLYDVAPAFDPGGKYLYFLSYRVFNPVYDDLRFDLGFYQGVKPCLITLQADTPSPFLPEPRPLVENGKGESGNTKDGKDDAADEKDEEDQGLRIDLDEIADRVLMFPVPEARYRAIQGIDGKVLFLSTPVAGVADSASDRRPKGTLHVYDLKNLKYETLAQGVTGFGFTFDRKTMVLRYDRRLRVLPAGKKPEDKPGEGDTHSRETGWINLGRIKAAVQPDVEWAQMLREAWRLQRDHFWTEDLSGVDWDAVWERYSRLLPRIATRDELSDLMWEMQGELGTSHAYEMGGDYRQGPNYGQGFLGASFTWDAERGGYRIVEVVKGDSWADDSSLRLPGVRLRVGDVLLAIDNRRLSPELPPAACLVGKGGAGGRFAGRPRRRRRREDGYREGAGTRRRQARTLSGVGRREPEEGTRGERRAVGLRARAGYGRRGVCRILSLLACRVGTGRTHRRCPAQRRWTRLKPSSGETGSAGRRILCLPLVRSRNLSRKCRSGTDCRYHERAGRVRRRHLQPRVQADGARSVDRQADVGRRDRYLAPASPGRRQCHYPARVRLLVSGCRVGRGKLRHGSRYRGGRPSRGVCSGRRCPAGAGYRGSDGQVGSESTRLARL